MRSCFLKTMAMKVSFIVLVFLISSALSDDGSNNLNFDPWSDQNNFDVDAAVRSAQDAVRRAQDVDKIVQDADREAKEMNDLVNSLNEIQHQSSIEVSTSDESDSGKGLGLAIFIAIAAGIKLLIIVCVIICRCCCGCCQKRATYVRTTVISVQPKCPQAQVDIDYPLAPSTPGYAPIPNNPVDQGIDNPVYAQNCAAPPPQYSSK